MKLLFTGLIFLVTSSLAYGVDARTLDIRKKFKHVRKNSQEVLNSLITKSLHKGVRECSGILLSPQLLLTAKHCDEISIGTSIYHFSGLGLSDAGDHIRLDNDVMLVELKEPISEIPKHLFKNITLARFDKKNVGNYTFFAGAQAQILINTYYCGLDHNTVVESYRLFAKGCVANEGASGGPLFELVMDEEYNYQGIKIYGVLSQGNDHADELIFATLDLDDSKLTKLLDKHSVKY